MAPKANKTSDKKYKGSKLIFKGAAEVKERSKFPKSREVTVELAQQAMDHGIGHKSTTTCKILATEGGIYLKKSGPFKSSPPQKFFKYNNILRFFIFAKDPQLVVFVSTDPKAKMGYYNLIKFKSDTQANTFCDVIQRGRQGASINGNAAPPPAIQITEDSTSHTSGSHTPYQASTGDHDPEMVERTTDHDSDSESSSSDSDSEPEVEKRPVVVPLHSSTSSESTVANEAPIQKQESVHVECAQPAAMLHNGSFSSRSSASSSQSMQTTPMPVVEDSNHFIRSSSNSSTSSGSVVHHGVLGHSVQPSLQQVVHAAPPREPSPIVANEQNVQHLQPVTSTPVHADVYQKRDSRRSKQERGKLPRNNLENRHNVPKRAPSMEEMYVSDRGMTRSIPNLTAQKVDLLKAELMRDMKFDDDWSVEMALIESDPKKGCRISNEGSVFFFTAHHMVPERHPYTTCSSSGSSSSDSSDDEDYDNTSYASGQQHHSRNSSNAQRTNRKGHGDYETSVFANGVH